MITGTFFGIAGVIIWGVIIVLALVICLISTLPGFRRSKQDPSFKGLDRRENQTSTDFLSKPIFKPLSQKTHDIMSEDSNRILPNKIKE